MVLEPIQCPACQRLNAVKQGKSMEDKQRYKCRKTECSHVQHSSCNTLTGVTKSEVKQQIGDMVVNGSGIRDTARDQIGM